MCLVCVFVCVAGGDCPIRDRGVGECGECSGGGSCADGARVDCEGNGSEGSTGCTVGNVVGGESCECSGEGVYDTIDRLGLGEGSGRGCKGCGVVSVGWVWG